MKKYTKYSIIFLFVFIISILVTSAGNDPFKKMKTLAQLIRLIYDNYVEEVDMDKELNGAFVGMLEKLDPHSSFIPVEDKEGIDEIFRGDFEGIGIQFAIIDGYNAPLTGGAFIDLANRGWTLEQILDHYYPGTTYGSLSDFGKAP